MATSGATLLSRDPYAVSRSPSTSKSRCCTSKSRCLLAHTIGVQRWGHGTERDYRRAAPRGTKVTDACWSSERCSAIGAVWRGEEHVIVIDDLELFGTTHAEDWVIRIV